MIPHLQQEPLPAAGRQMAAEGQAQQLRPAYIRSLCPPRPTAQAF